MPSFTVGAELPASAEKLWAASLKDAPLIIPKIAPQAVASIENVDGPAGEVGAVRLTKLGTAFPAGSFVKEKLVAVDAAKLTASTEDVEGGHFDLGFTKWVSTVKFTPISDSACKWETIVDYEGENESAIANAKERIPKMMSGLAAYVNTSA